MASKLVTFFILVALVVCQSMSPLCGMTTPTSPTLTMQFTPSMPVQVPPTSTVYGIIMTSYWNVVDCKYVMVENIDDNPAQTGSYFYKTTIPTLTVNRVGCMPETTAITRRSLRGYDLVEDTPQTIHLDTPSTLQKRAAAMAAVTNTILRIAGQHTREIDPNNDGLTVEAYRYLMQINTALFAINLVNSGLPLNRTCAELREAQIMNQLRASSIDPKQAGDIVCYAVDKGLFFNRTNGEILSDLAALEYAIQVRSGFTTEVQRLCETIDLSAAPFLGIDAAGIKNLVCNGANSTSTTSSATAGASLTTTFTSNLSAATNVTNTSVPPTATGFNMTFFPNTTTVSVSPAPISTNSTGAAANASSPASLTPISTNATGATNASTPVPTAGFNVSTSANNTSVSSTIAFTPTLITGGTAGTIIASATSAAGVPGPFTNSSTGAVAVNITNTLAVPTGSLVSSANGTVVVSGSPVGAVGTVGTGLSTSSGSILNTTKEVSHTPPTPTVPFYYPVWSATTTPDFLRY